MENACRKNGATHCTISESRRFRSAAFLASCIKQPLGSSPFFLFSMGPKRKAIALRLLSFTQLLQQGRAIPLRQNLIALPGIVKATGLVLLKETNGIHPSERFHQCLKSLASQLDRIHQNSSH